jgi:hypothetical protein
MKREGKKLPPGAGVDKNGQETTDPNEVAALNTFGAHKGFGMALIDELYAAYTGGGAPTMRNRWEDTSRPGEKQTWLVVEVPPPPPPLPPPPLCGPATVPAVSSRLQTPTASSNPPPSHRRTDAQHFLRPVHQARCDGR